MIKKTTLKFERIGKNVNENISGDCIHHMGFHDFGNVNEEIKK